MLPADIYFRLVAVLDGADHVVFVWSSDCDSAQDYGIYLPQQQH